MRKIHRWISVVTALFMMFVSATGIALQIDLMLSGNPIPGSEGRGGPGLGLGPDPAASDPPSDEDIQQLVQKTLMVVHEAKPAFHPDKIEISLGGMEGKRGVASAGVGPSAQKVTVDLAAGKLVDEGAKKQGGVGLHFFFQNLHAFYVLGPVGQWISITLGAALFILSGTGLWMYFDLYMRRARNGKKSPFWS